METNNADKIRRLVCQIIQDSIDKGEFPYEHIKGQRSYLWEMYDLN